MARRKSTIKNLVVIGDTHCGSKVGLCPPGGVKLLDGGTYKPSKFQTRIWRCWRYFWREWVPKKTKGEPFTLVINGDAHDWDHHGTATIISKQTADHLRCAKAVLGPVAALADRVLVASGSRAHSGEQGEAEESLAEFLGAEVDEMGRTARYEMWVEVGRALCHIAHTIGSTSSASYETTAVHKELIDAFTESGMWQKRAPNFVIRSHRHRYCKTTIPAEMGDAESVVTPGWQGKTPFIYRTARGRSAPAQVGGVLIRSGADGEVYELHKVWSMDRPKVVR